MESQKNICLIDDDHIYQFLCKKTIEKSRYIKNLVIFSNGKEALDYFIKHQNDDASLPDLIFLDLEMPLMDGWQFLDEYLPIKSHLSKNMVIYISTSSTHPVDLSRAKEINEIKGYLIKPLTAECFEKIMERSPS